MGADQPARRRGDRHAARPAGAGIGGLPLWASGEAGLVTYFETPIGWQVALMGPDQVRLLERISGRSYADYSFPFWKHMWGWLFVLGLVVWYLLHRRAEAKWREETGII
jgi:hypothetical protein